MPSVPATGASASPQAADGTVSIHLSPSHHIGLIVVINQTTHELSASFSALAVKDHTAYPMPSVPGSVATPSLRVAGVPVSTHLT